MQVTLEELQQFTPHADPVFLQAIIEGAGALERAGITTPLRLCHFLGQCAHETGGFALHRELTTWTPEQMCALWPARFKTKLDPRIIACRGDEQKLANLAYSSNEKLGNLGGDDG